MDTVLHILRFMSRGKGSVFRKVNYLVSGFVHSTRPTDLPSQTLHYSYRQIRIHTQPESVPDCQIR